MKSKREYPQKTEGLIAAPFTPFNQNCELDVSRIPAYANWLAQEQAAGAFICGTTGESPSMTLQERLTLAEAWMDAVPGNLRIIVHVGHNSLAEAKSLATHAESIGAHAIGCMPPFFFQPRNIEEVTVWCEQVAQAAPDLPFYYYHIPSMSGVNLKVAQLIPELSKRLPSFVGVKFTYEDIEDYRNCLLLDDGRYDILFGRDEKLLSAIEVGATGAVGSTYNFAAPLYHRIFTAYREGDIDTATGLQQQAVRLIDICINNTWHPIAAFKTIMELAGFNLGPTRPPIPSLTLSQKQSLESQIREFFDAGLLHPHELPKSV